MSFLQSHHKSGWITDLVLPGRLSDLQLPGDILETGRQIAIEMCSNPIYMCRLNPLVQAVEMIDDSHPKAVDHRAMGKSFGVDVDELIAKHGAESSVSETGRQISDEIAELNRRHPIGEFRNYAITDKLSPLPGIPYTTLLTYHSNILRTPTGMITFTNPGSGVSIYGTFTINIAHCKDNKALDASDGKGWVVNLLETNETKCNIVLGSYIRATTDKSHRQAHGRFKEEWRGRMKERGFEFSG
jgi:hypothetical protein